MMLKTDKSNKLPEQISAYVGQALHASIEMFSAAMPEDLPVFLSRAYEVYETSIVENRCLILLKRDHEETPGDMAKQIRLVEAKTEQIVILGLSALSARDRSRLIAQGIAFIVPGNQFYVPALAMDLREHYRAQKLRPQSAFSPAAQAVFFHHMLRRNEAATTPSILANELGYSPMSIGRAFDDLAALGLAESERRGRKRHLRFLADRRELMEGARTLLRSPVQSQKLVWGPHVRPAIKQGGELALAALTDLSPPSLDVYAIAAAEWKGFAASHEYYEDGRYGDPDFALETWSYSPAGLSDDDTVDALSLYAQFWDHQDERVAMAAEKLLERVPWS